MSIFNEESECVTQSSKMHFFATKNTNNLTLNEDDVKQFQFWHVVIMVVILASFLSFCWQLTLNPICDARQGEFPCSCFLCLRFLL